MKKRIKSIIAAGLSLVLVFSMTGCGNRRKDGSRDQSGYTSRRGAFPLKEKAELSFITNAPATSTQEPNERDNLQKTGKTDECTY